MNEHYTTQFKAVASSLPGCDVDWLQSYRRQAFADFIQSGFPTQHQEPWKYTNVKAIRHGDFQTSTQTCPAAPFDLLNDLIPTIDGQRLVFVNGFFNAPLSSTETDHLVFMNLATALSTDPEKIQIQLRETTQESFVHLNSAFMADGVLLHIPDNTVVTKPIHIIHLHHHHTSAKMSHQRHLISLGTNSQAHIIESHIGVAQHAYFNTHVSQIHLQPNAVLHHDYAQQEANRGLHIDYCQVQQAQDSQYHRFTFDIGSQLTRHDLNCHLHAAGAHCTLNGLYITDKKQHIDNHTVIHHHAPQTTSNENYKGILHDKSRAVFSGRVVVAKDAQKINANQQNNNLLLSHDAEIDTKPQLEIYADDVKCAHGATIGQLDQKALFYLQSRGIPQQAAKDILVFGFAKSMLEHLTIPSIRQYFKGLLINKLPHKTHIEDQLYDTAYL